jgi:hypothetical protein
MSQLGLTAVPCLRLGPVELCLPVGTGVIEARVRGSDQAPARSAVVHVGARAAAAWRPTHGIALAAWAQVDLALIQPSVYVDGDRVWAAPPVAGIFGLTLIGFP